MPAPIVVIVIILIIILIMALRRSRRCSASREEATVPSQGETAAPAAGSP